MILHVRHHPYTDNVLFKSHVRWSAMVAKHLGSHGGLGMQLTSSLRSDIPTRLLRRIGDSCNTHQARPCFQPPCQQSPRISQSGSLPSPNRGRVKVANADRAKEEPGMGKQQAARVNLVWQINRSQPTGVEPFLVSICGQRDLEEKTSRTGVSQAVQVQSRHASIVAAN